MKIRRLSSRAIYFLLGVLTVIFFQGFIDILKITTTNKSILFRECNSSYHPPVYVVGVYQINDQLIRAILIKPCSLNITIQASLNDDPYIDGNLTVINSGCPTFTHKGCTFGGFYAEFEIENRNFLNNNIKLRREACDKDGFVVAPIVQTYLKEKKPKHFLAVCIKPLFYFDDWIQLVQFIEYYHVNGATKFFLYWQSMSEQVKQAFDNYIEDGIEIELIDWAHLPSEDADSNLLNTGQIESINDCLHRARSQAEFVAVIDFDELISVRNGSLVDLLKKLDKRDSGYSFLSMKVTSPTYYYSSSNPSSLSFEPLASVSIDELKAIWVRKIIIRPELVRRAVTHGVITYEENARRVIKCSEQVASNVHARSVKDFHVAHSKKAFNYTAMSSSSVLMTENWQNRVEKWLKKDTDSLTILPNRTDFIRSMEACFVRLWRKRKVICFTARPCQYVAESFDMIWQTSEVTWVEI